MSRVKLALSACVAVLAFSALASAAASAAPAGWMVNGTNLGATGTAALATTARVDKKGKLTAVGITIECGGEVLTGVGPKINQANLMGEVTSIGFTGCISITEGCTLAKEDENIKTLPLLVNVTLDGVLAIKGQFVPKTKTTFTTLKYEGETCALAGIQPVTGSVEFLAHEGQDERTLQIVLISSTEASGSLKVGSSSAVISGAALLRLESGQSWSFL